MISRNILSRRRFVSFLLRKGVESQVGAGHFDVGICQLSLDSTLDHWEERVRIIARHIDEPGGCTCVAELETLLSECIAKLYDLEKRLDQAVTSNHF
jgi:hypothetical protein